MEQVNSNLVFGAHVTLSLAKHLRLGDVILAVNGRSLQGASHAEAVLRLKLAGPTVLLRIKPNQVLAGTATSCNCMKLGQIGNFPAPQLCAFNHT